MNAHSFEKFGDPEIQTRISQYEMAFRMQTSVPELVDLKQESQATLDMYGPEVLKPGSFAASAILARRLIERGTRVVQVLHRGWDQHGNLPADIRLQCRDESGTHLVYARSHRRQLLGPGITVHLMRKTRIKSRGATHTT